MKSKFTTELVTVVHGDNRMLKEHLRFLDCHSSAFYITVPKGFITDGASIPKMAWSVLGVNPYYSSIFPAAVVHDWLYCQKYLGRKEADKVFKRAMDSIGKLSKAQTYLIYWAVRLFGGVAYKRKCRESCFER